MSLRFSQNAEIPCLAEELLASLGLCYMELVSWLVIFLRGLSSPEEQYDPSEHWQNAVHSKNIDLLATQFSGPQTFQYSLRHPVVKVITFPS
jgi:hypothetical protein